MGSPGNAYAGAHKAAKACIAGKGENSYKTRELVCTWDRALPGRERDIETRCGLTARTGTDAENIVRRINEGVAREEQGRNGVRRPVRR